VSQDIQLSPMNNVPMQGDYFPSGGSMGGPPPAGNNPLSKLHRLLRGRYPIVIALGLIFGAVGGAIGYFSQKPGYSATGIVSVSPMARSLENVERTMPMFTSFMRVQVEVLRSPKLIERALKTEAWKSTQRDASPAAASMFAYGLFVETPKGTNLIQITYMDPEASVATAGVKAITDAYVDIQKELEQSTVLKDIETVESRKDKLDSNIRAIQNEINELGSPYGTTDLTAVHSQRMAEQSKIQGRISDLEVTLNTWVPGGPTTKPVSPLTPEEIARTDKAMALYIAERDAATFQYEMNKDRMKENHPFMIEQKARVTRANELIKKKLEDAASNPVFQLMEPGMNGEMNVNLVTPETIKKNIVALQKQLEDRKRATAEVSQAWMKIQAKQGDLAIAQDSLRKATAQLDVLATQSEGLGRITIVNDGGSAFPAADKRKLAAAGGALGGIAVPAGLMLLIGLMDSRLRYSDETDTDMSGITLLGILPNLPDRLSDPEQAATAAHCVHQIRTMLQINGAASDQAVFAVTSAAPGDGKTSLTLALGLSFAACGSRTLLIDCDLIGAGLTRRLGVNSETGILEAASTRTILEHIRTTEIADVAILPVGAAGTMHASTLSPNSLRRIIQEAKKHFDVILIDTGPILGSIEASLVATVADGIVLTVARGQHRGMVEKSLRHLMGIGAKISGVVFNRAQARDFERSLSNMSMRSVGLIGNPTAENRYGPLGRAVQGSVQK
jgi:succinoglycan biosynthesis transport protein ExoP